MTELHLTLKKKWWDMIASGEKKEEYREIKPYWIRRLCFTNKEIGCVERQEECGPCFKNVQHDCGYVCYPFDEVVFHKGYTSETMRFKINSISYGYGVPEWGAPEEQVFIIKFDNNGSN